MFIHLLNGRKGKTIMSKKLVGGEYLLDLSPITIAKSVDGETYTNITNQEVIEQLTNLKEYIRNPKAIKPVWVKFVNDEDDAVYLPCNDPLDGKSSPIRTCSLLGCQPDHSDLL